MRMQVILDSSVARPGSAPIWGGKKGEFRNWTRKEPALLLRTHFREGRTCQEPEIGAQARTRKWGAKQLDDTSPIRRPIADRGAGELWARDSLAIISSQMKVRKLSDVKSLLAELATRASQSVLCLTCPDNPGDSLCKPGIFLGRVVQSPIKLTQG